MGTAIVITSGKGGTGKTTVTAGLASCLAALGRRTLCVDGDAVLKNLDLSLGLADTALYDYGDVIAGRCTLNDAIIPHPAIENLHFLTAPVEQPGPGLPKLINEIKNSFDYCLIDSPAGLGFGFREAAGGADKALIVSLTDPSSCRDAGRTVQELNTLGIYDVRLIINRVQPSILRTIKTNLDDIIDRIGARLLGYIPEDRSVIISAAMETPLVLCSDGEAAAAL